MQADFQVSTGFAQWRTREGDILNMRQMTKHHLVSALPYASDRKKEEIRQELLRRAERKRRKVHPNQLSLF